MEKVLHVLEQELPPAERLRLVQFYMPRLLASNGLDRAMWWQALALQQLGSDVLDTHALFCQLTSQPVPAELPRRQASLNRLSHYLRDHLRAPARLRSFAAEQADWEHVQLHLKVAMPLVEHLLSESAYD